MLYKITNEDEQYHFRWEFMKPSGKQPILYTTYPST